MNINATRKSHVLVTLGVLFTLGGATRLMFSNFAEAEDAPTTTVSVADTGGKVDLGDPDAFSQVPGNGQICFSGETANLLAEDQSFLNAETERLEQERLALKAWEQELERQTAELKTLQEALDGRWREMQVAADEDMQHLAMMYGAMKADQAANIFNQMDPSFAAGFLRLLPSEQAGQIMAGMTSEKAYIVSVELASLNNDIRTASATN